MQDMKNKSNIPNFHDYKVDYEVVSDALRSIPFPLPYNDWLRIGFALYANFGMDGMRLLHEVSCARFPEYQNETPEKLAAKFRNANGSVTLGTIFHFARQHGWKYKKPTKRHNEECHLVAWHDYTDAQGNFAYRIKRYVMPNGKKDMAIERYEKGERKFDLPPEFRLPYNLPQVREAIQQGKTIYFVEGESDADALTAYFVEGESDADALTANDYTATCVPFGADGWNQRYAEHFKGAIICFVPDNDETGKKLPSKAIPDLLEVAKEVKVIELSDAKDVRELINTKGIEAFRSLTPIDASQYLAKHKLSEKYPLTTLNGMPAPETDLDDDDENEQTYDVAIPELPNGLFKQVYDYLAAFDVPRAFALTGATALLATILGDRIGFYFDDENEEENEEENEDGMIFANDYFIQMAPSGSGKSTTSRKVRSLLRSIDKKIMKTDGKRSELLYKNAATARGLIDQIRYESDAERDRREAAERAAEKSGQAPPSQKKTPQTSGLWLLDEFVQLLESFKSEFNAELCSIILSLWDNTEFSRQTKSDGAIDVPQTSITILGNSVPEMFWQALPVNASRRGFLQRLLIVTTTESRRKTMLQVKFAKKKVARKVLCEDLLDFFCYCAKRPPVKFLKEECMPVEIEFISRYQTSDKDIKAFLDRLNVRLLKFSMIVATCKAFETRAPEIVIDARTMEQAGVILDFFVRSTINFITANSIDSQKPIDAVGKLKARMLSLLRDKFSGEVKRKVLRDYSNAGDQLFKKALDELVESGKVKLVERNVRGQKVVFVKLTAKFTSPFLTSPCNNHNRNSTETQTPEKLGKKGEKPATSPLLHSTSPFEINTTVTQPQPQKGEKGEVKKGEVTTVPGPSNPEPVNPEPTVPGPSNPEPMPAPEPKPEPEPPQPMPVVEPETEPTIAAKPVVNPESLLSANACEIARSLCAEFTENEFRKHAMQFFGATPQTAKAMLNLLVKNGYLLQQNYLFIRTNKLYTSESEAKPLPAPEPKPEPEPTFIEPETPLNVAPQANAHDLANLVLSHLEKFWNCRKIPGESLRQIIATNCGKQAIAVWKLLFPAHIVKLHTTDFFIFRDDKRRPKGYEGLIPDSSGVLPSDEPAPF
jgi:hypothetical protein